MAQSTSSSPRLPSKEDLRPKQKEIVDALLSTASVIAQLPTGYGKTKAGAAAFAQLQKAGKANRLLWIVPRRRLATQAAQDVPEELQKFGIKTKAMIVGQDRIRSTRAHALGSILVFICTVQSLLSEGTRDTILSMMETGKWMTVVDEHHHFSIEGEWTSKVRSLRHCTLLAMSATALRRDGEDHFGEPQIKETYLNSARAGFVKKLHLHAYHYTIDAIEINGTIHRFTTEELARQAGSDNADAIDAFMSSRKMRFSPKYISPLVTFPVDRMIDHRARGLQTQMLIQAMSCSHARCIVEQIRPLVPDTFEIDWVGTGPHGRNNDENDKILSEFCPDKNRLTGERDWALDILVNVGMAGEGLDSIDVSEVVFLTPANITTMNLQTMGRGARPIIGLPESMAQPKCNINVDTGSPMAKFIGEQVMQIFDQEFAVQEDEDADDEKPEEGPGDDEYQELPENLGWIIADMRLLEIRSQPMFQAIFEGTKKATARATNLSEEQVAEESARQAERVIREYLNRNNNQGAILAQKTDQIEMAVGVLAGLVIKRLMRTGMRVERSLAGDLKKRINAQKKHALHCSVVNASEEELERHYRWLKDLEQRILGASGLEGVPPWLR
jgi:superfamily II DNA or RNA helicase